MDQKLKRANRKRFASLSALGAGALGVAASPANANDIVFSGVINVVVPNPVRSYTIPGPNGAGGVVRIAPFCQLYCSASTSVAILSKPGKYGTQFRVLATGSRHASGTVALAEPLGAVWGTVAGKSVKSADIYIQFYGGGIETTFNSTDRYLLFRFRGGALKHDMYGWARIQLTGFFNDDVGIVDWAYDPTGVHLPAGYHGPGQTDREDVGTAEPSTLDATGLPALALGASGLRRLRAARAAEAANVAASAPAN